MSAARTAAAPATRRRQALALHPATTLVAAAVALSGCEPAGRTLADMFGPSAPPASVDAAATGRRALAEVVLGGALVGGTAARGAGQPLPSEAAGADSIDRARAGVEASLQRSVAAAQLLDLWHGGAAPAPANDPAAVRQAQRLLAALGYYKGPVTGVNGPLSRAAIGRFQAIQGLPETGEVTSSLLLALRAAL